MPVYLGIMPVERFCWIATHGYKQRWGSATDGIRYSTDFNAAALERTDLKQLSLQERRARGVCADRVLGFARIQADSVYDSLMLLADPGQRSQYSFWASVFGPMSGRLFFFRVVEAVRLQQPIEIPILKWTMRSFFVRLDHHHLLSSTTLKDTVLQQGIDLPAWFEESSFLCVRLPAPFACKIASAEWGSFALPDPDHDHAFHKERRRLKIIGWKHVLDLQADFPRAIPGESLENTELTSGKALRAADTIRLLAARLLDSEEPELLQACREAATILQAFHDELDPVNMHQGILELRGRSSSKRCTLPYQARFLIQSLMLCYHLRDASDLKKVLIRAVELIVPRGFRAAVLEPLKANDTCKVPSPSTLSRGRLIADVAYMLCMREIHEASLQKSCVRFLMVDASVQGHYDFELIRCVSVDASRSQDLVRAAQSLFSLWRPRLEAGEAVDNFAEEASARERDAFELIAACVDVHLPPSVVIGSGFASLYHKYHAVIHALWLETGSASLLSQYCASIFGFTSDQGVEFGLSKVPPLRAVQVLPWMPLPSRHMDMHDWAPAEQVEQVHQAAMIDFRGSVSVAGCLHIIHNSTSDLAKSMPHFDDMVTSIQAVSRLLRRRDSKERLLQTCFADNVGRHLQSTIRSFTAKVHKGRWGSLSDAVEQLLKVERSLRWGWDVAKYGAHRPQAGQDTEGVDVAAADAAITSCFFWGYVHMLAGLTGVTQAALSWAEGCPCHSDLPTQGVPKDVLRQWAKCPLRGCRGPDLAAGKFMDVLRTLGDRSASHLLTSLPRDVSLQERAVLLREFELGRAHLLFVLSLRFQFWKSLPWSIFGCGHVDEAISKDFLQRSSQLQCSNDCRLLSELQSPELAAEVVAYLVEGAALSGLVLLPRYLLKLMFFPTAERAVEGDHAQAHG